MTLLAQQIDDFKGNSNELEKIVGESTQELNALNRQVDSFVRREAPLMVRPLRTNSKLFKESVSRVSDKLKQLATGEKSQSANLLQQESNKPQYSFYIPLPPEPDSFFELDLLGRIEKRLETLKNREELQLPPKQPTSNQLPSNQPSSKQPTSKQLPKQVPLPQQNQTTQKKKRNKKK